MFTAREPSYKKSVRIVSSKFNSLTNFLSDSSYRGETDGVEARADEKK